MNPARGLVLVKPVTTAETLGGGQIIIPVKSREAMTAHQMIVVDVGPAEICEEPDDCERVHGWFLHDEWDKQCAFHPVDPRIVKGAWVLVRPRSLVDAGQGVLEKLYFVRQDEVLGVFEVREEAATP